MKSLGFGPKLREKLQFFDARTLHLLVRNQAPLYLSKYSAQKEKMPNFCLFVYLAASE